MHTILLEPITRIQFPSLSKSSAHHQNLRVLRENQCFAPVKQMHMRLET
jgi:hypothetical protein